MWMDPVTCFALLNSFVYFSISRWEGLLLHFFSLTFSLFFFQANHGGIRGKEIPQQFFNDEGREENGNEFDSDDDDEIDYRQLVEHAKEVIHSFQYQIFPRFLVLIYFLKTIVLYKSSFFLKNYSFLIWLAIKAEDMFLKFMITDASSAMTQSYLVVGIDSVCWHLL